MSINEKVPPLVIIRHAINQKMSPRSTGEEVDLVVYPPNSREAIRSANNLAPVTAKIEQCPFLCLDSLLGQPAELKQEISALFTVACFHIPSLEELTQQGGKDNIPTLWTFGLAAASEIVALTKIHKAKRVLVLAVSPMTSVLELAFLGPDFLESPDCQIPWAHNQRCEIWIGNGWGPNHNDQY
jgi:hypothetical protein